MDSSRGIRNTLRERLEYEGFHVETAESAESAVELARHIPFDVFLTTDLQIATRIGIPFIVLSEHCSIEEAIDCVRAGAADFIPKPIDMNRLLDSVKKLCEEAPEVEKSTPLKPPKRRSSHVEEIVGESPQIRHVKQLIDKVAPSEARVLIMGANGTGKELVARWLHEKSHRSEAPFVEVNCAAIPSELIESELFGHEKGAFTSAIKQRRGKFEQANGGTLFMDEIGDMSLSAQAKVLRALQENRISRVGSDKDVEVDVRVIAATNKNLREEIEKGRFREDLYHRLSVIVISVPPLIERVDDIPLLIDSFSEKICTEYGIAPKQFDAAAVAELKKMPWRGNIRELHNVVERLIILSGEQISAADVKTYAEAVV